MAGLAKATEILKEKRKEMLQVMFPYLKQALSNLFMKPSTIAFPAGDPPKAKEPLSWSDCVQ